MNPRLIAVSLLLLVSGFSFAQSCSSGGTAVGTAFFNHTNNWSQTGDLYYSVTGAPANVCGALATIRNGSCLYTPNWVCTDANGNATGGPWTWANTPGDQTDTNVHFDWPNGTTTYFTTDHVWDKTCATATIAHASSTSSSRTFDGSASDTQWGAGFDDGWSNAVYAVYYDQTTGKYWGGGSTYDAANTEWVGNITSPMPNHNITWAMPTTSVPPPGSA